MTTHTKQPLQLFDTLLTTFALCALVLFGAVKMVGAATERVSGWAWSDTAGWIDMSGVSITSPGGAFSGWAWSDTVGWISFNANGCGPAPTLSTNGSVSGWARAVNGSGAPADDQWASLTGMRYTGCIELGGGNGVRVDFAGGNATQGNFSGWGWGGTVIGWVDFDGVFVNIDDGGAVVNLSASPVSFSTAGSGKRTNLSWTVSPNIETCRSDGGPWSLDWSDGQSTSKQSDAFSLTQSSPDVTFRITCETSDGLTDTDAVVVFLDDSSTADAACNDGNDNDGDGLIDHPADPGCSSPADDDESDSGAFDPIFEEI